MLTRVVVQLVERRQEGPAEGEPAEEQEVRPREEAEQFYQVITVQVACSLLSLA